MIRIFTTDKEFHEITDLSKLQEKIDNTIWIDLLCPEPAQVEVVEKLLNIDIPTKEEMAALEVSNRLYQENGNYFLTISILANSETQRPTLEPVTFTLVGGRIVTLRYIDPHSFKAFISRKARIPTENHNGREIMVSLIESIVERLADVMEKNATNVDDLTKTVFRPTKLTSKGKRSTNYEKVLKEIGYNGDIVSKSRESLLSISRMVAYIRQTSFIKQNVDDMSRLDVMDQDLRALSDQANFIINKITFLLDATLGMISIQQNSIIKIFTVATMVFLPPTLIASIYGMNFQHMPELDWRYGYGIAILLMLVSAYVPFRYFKKKGWL